MSATILYFNDTTNVFVFITFHWCTSSSSYVIFWENYFGIGEIGTKQKMDFRSWGEDRKFIYTCFIKKKWKTSLAWFSFLHKWNYLHHSSGPLYVITLFPGMEVKYMVDSPTSAKWPIVLVQAHGVEPTGETSASWVCLIAILHLFSFSYSTNPNFLGKLISSMLRRL